MRAFLMLSFSNEAFVCLKILLHSDDEIASRIAILKAMIEEVNDFLEGGMFKVNLRRDIPTGANVLTGSFTLSINFSLEGKVEYKAQYYIPGRRDKMDGFNGSHWQHPESTNSPAVNSIILDAWV